MTGSARYVCCICAMPIRLETSKTDEHGHAVHEECYVCKMISKIQTSQRGSPRQELAEFDSF